MPFILPFLVFMVAVFFVPLGLIVFTSVVADGTGEFTLQYFQKFFTGAIYLRVLRISIEVAFISTVLTLVVGYPLAYYLAKQAPRRRIYLSTLLLLPFYTSILVKSFAFQIILGREGTVNWAVTSFLGPEARLELLYNRLGVYIGIVHDMLPFLVFPILVSLLAQDSALHRAAELMGASKRRIFWTVTFPLSLPGVMAGVLIVMVRAMGQYAIPQILGGRQDVMMANLVGFHLNEIVDWGMASAISMVLLAVSLVFLIALSRIRAGETHART